MNCGSCVPTAPSMGMMLETTSRQLYEEPGGVHYGSPDKDPAVRLAVIDDAGVAGFPSPRGFSSASARRWRTGPSR